MQNIFWEIIWIIALLLNILSYHEKNDKKMFFMLAITSLFYGFHFYWIGLMTASLVNFFDIAKNIIVTRYKKNTPLFIFFAISYSIIGVMTSNGEILSYLLVFSSILTLYAAFYFRGIALRIVYLIATFAYLLYSIDGESLSGTLTALLFLILLSSSIYVLHKYRGVFWKIRYMKVCCIKGCKKRWYAHKRRFKIFGT